MCNLYSLTKAQFAIRDWFRGSHDHTGNLPLFPAIFPTSSRRSFAMDPTASASSLRGFRRTHPIDGASTKFEPADRVTSRMSE